MSAIESLIFLLGAAAVLAQLARSVNVPYPIFLVLGGLAIAGSTTEEYAESSAAWHDWRRELLAA